jgi:hypothetical protein
MWATGKRFVVPILFQSSLLTAEIRIVGRVTNDNNSPIGAALVTIKSPAGSAITVTTKADGGFQCSLPGPGEYVFQAEREGHFRLQDHVLRLSAAENEVQLILNPIREVYESVEVKAAPSRVDFDRPGSTRNMSGAEMLAIPFPASNNVKNALRTMPNVVQDPKGGVHLNGAAEEQALYTLNGFMINDPLTGRFDSRLGVEAVQSVDIAGGAVSAEFGKGTAGTVAITTNPGDDRFRYGATNFFPGFETRKGIYLGNWSPRFNFSGPFKQGRAWFSDSIALQYDKEVIEDLPRGADQLTSWRSSNILQTQINLTPSNILYAGMLTNLWNAPRTGLNFLTPPESTIDRRSRQWFYNVKQQSYFGRGALLEVGFALNRTFGREIPQGSEFLRITPEGNRGNSYFDARRRAGREQVLLNYFLPAFALRGSHQFKTGVDLDRISYWQDVRRTGYMNLRSEGSVVRHVTFGGNSLLERSSFETSVYLLDSWRISPRLLVELGLRGDRDTILRNWNLSPRAGIAWAPFRARNTKVSAAYSVIYDTANLRLFTRPYDQYSLTTYFTTGGELARGPAASLFAFSETPPRTPHSRIVSAGMERMFLENLYVRINILSRRVRDGFTYVSSVAGGFVPPASLVRHVGVDVFDAIFTLSNTRRDTYDHFEVTLRQSLSGQYGWLASYVRSRALSNGVVDLNIDDPIIVTQNEGPMPWDSPNRFLSWAYLPLFWKNYAVAYLLESRSGFPFSTKDEIGGFVGKINSFRFPAFFTLNLHGERRFVFRGYRWEFRAGFNNITNHKNHNLVNSNIDSPNFMHFYGGQGRSLNFRIRWLGRAPR